MASKPKPDKYERIANRIMVGIGSKDWSSQPYAEGLRNDIAAALRRVAKRAANHALVDAHVLPEKERL